MSRVQIRAVALTTALSALDGFDVLALTFAAPGLSAAWGVDRAVLGLVFSSGLAGMALGALAVAPFADLTGRRPAILLGLLLMGAGMLLAGLSQTPAQLAGWRLLTGVGVGLCIALTTSLAAEFANARHRAFAVAVTAVGYPAGGFLGGLLAAGLLSLHDWRAIFHAGFVLAAIMLPLVVFWLPESPAFLAARQGANSLKRLNAYLARCGHRPIAALPPPAGRARTSYRGLFAPGQTGRTIRISAVNFMGAATSYYILSWMPQLIVDAGFSAAAGSLVASASSLGGLLSGVCVGLAARRVPIRALVAALMCAMGLATAAFGLAPPSLGLLVACAVVCGLCLYAMAAGLYALIAESFEPAFRASGAGLATGMGRISSAIAPAVAGWMFSAGFERAEVSVIFGAFALAAAVILVVRVPWPARRAAA